MKSTPVILLSKPDDPVNHQSIWKLTADEFFEFKITPMSKGGDVVWACPPTTPGVRQKDCQVNWGMELIDGSRLIDPRHARRLEWAKKLMALILHAPVGGNVPSPTSMVSFQLGFKWLLSWMAMRCVCHPHELDVQLYIDDLPRYITERNDGDEITIHQVSSALFILTWLWSERRLLYKWGVPSISENPFRDQSLNCYAKSIATKAAGWIPPLPDEVAIPLFNEVAWWLAQPADDVVRLLNYVNDPLRGIEPVVTDLRFPRDARRPTAGEGKLAWDRRANRYIAEFRFTTFLGETEPWHVAIDSTYERNTGINPRARVRILFDAVRDACSLAVQGMSGMRTSELLGIEAGFEAASGLPKGVRIENSATGLYEIFIMRTGLSKTERGLPREMDWTLGMRPKGSQDEPLPVRALRLLNSLYEPWRARAKSTRLFLAGTPSEALARKTSALGAMNSDKIRDCMKRFIERWVDLSGLPDESRRKIKDNDLIPWRQSRGRIFKSHMLRKSFAQFMFAVDPRLIPAIQLQFHHLSLAMTDSGYIGNNPLLLVDIDSVGTQSRNLMILEMVLGRNPLAGKMGEELEHVTKALAEKVKDLPTSDAYAAVVKFCEQAQLPIFFSPHGACMPVQTHEMRCHDEAGTLMLLRNQPNARTRQPSLCAGCSCFVLDARHADFWASRYTENWLAYKRAERSGDVIGYKVIKERAQQAGKLLKKIGVEVERLDCKIELTLESEHVPF